MHDTDVRFEITPDRERRWDELAADEDRYALELERAAIRAEALGEGLGPPEDQESRGGAGMDGKCQFCGHSTHDPGRCAEFTIASGRTDYVCHCSGGGE